MPSSPIKSRPIYPGLAVDEAARRHLVAAEGEGGLAVIEAFGGHPAALARTTIVYSPGGSAARGHEEALAALKPDALHLAPTQQTLLVRFEGLLATATMGTRIYVAGVEGLIGSVVALGLAHGVEHH
jgi:hypothetical protein